MLKKFQAIYIEISNELKTSYHISEYLYEQASGSLYKGTHILTGQSVLLYHLSFESSKCDFARWEDVFKLTIAELKSIPSAYLVEVIDYFINENGPYIVMKNYDITPLRQLYPNAMGISELRQFVVESLNALEDIHKLDHIHGGISPESFIVSPNSNGSHRYKIIDLFIKELVPFLNGWLVSSYIPSHPALLPAEFFEGGLIDQRSDIYTLGQTFYYMVLGGHPFVELDHEEIYSRHKNHSIYELKAILADFPEDLSDLIEYMTQADPADRPQSIQQLRENSNFFTQLQISTA